tara:strand:+ start:681 stop:1106 length:426 start_codon:yes stop_codon:yes gene_type:complete
MKLNKNQLFISYFIISVLLIFIYGFYRCKSPEKKDILEKEYILNLDGWSLTHLIFFSIVAYNFPTKKYLIASFILGIIWELGELILSWVTINNRLGSWSLFDCKKLNTDKNDEGVWWYAKESDIFMNLLGLIIGYSLHKYI